MFSCTPTPISISALDTIVTVCENWFHVVGIHVFVSHFRERVIQIVVIAGDALEGAQVLVQREKEVQLCVNSFGEGRSVYISGLPYSFENARLLYRSVLWASSSEDSLYCWYSENPNVDVHAYVKNGKFCVVNNTYVPQKTVIYRGDGSSFDLDIEANGILWYEI